MFPTFTDQPKSKLVHTFPGSSCGVPTIVAHYLVQSAPVMHGLMVLDIGNGSKPVEVSRLKLSEEFYSHWTGWDAKTQRLVVTGWGGSTPVPRESGPRDRRAHYGHRLS